MTRFNINQATKYGTYTTRENYYNQDGSAVGRQTYVSRDGQTSAEYCAVANIRDDSTVYSSACGGYGDTREPYEAECSSCFLNHSHTRWAHFQQVNAKVVNNPWATCPKPEPLGVTAALAA